MAAGRACVRGGSRGEDQRGPGRDLEAEEITLLASHEFANGLSFSSISSWDHFLFAGTMDSQTQAVLVGAELKFTTGFTGTKQ